MSQYIALGIIAFIIYASISEGISRNRKRKIIDNEYNKIKDNKKREQENEVSNTRSEQTFDSLIPLVEEWAREKDLLYYHNREKQFGKVKEEVTELEEEITAGTHDGIKEELGDVLVTLIILSNQLQVDITECLEIAYNKIASRKGKTIDGVFVKEEDL